MRHPSFLIILNFGTARRAYDSGQIPVVAQDWDSGYV